MPIPFLQRSIRGRRFLLFRIGLGLIHIPACLVSTASGYITNLSVDQFTYKVPITGDTYTTVNTNETG